MKGFLQLLTLHIFEEINMHNEDLEKELEQEYERMMSYLDKSKGLPVHQMCYEMCNALMQAIVTKLRQKGLLNKEDHYDIVELFATALDSQKHIGDWKLGEQIPIKGIKTVTS